VKLILVGAGIELLGAAGCCCWFGSLDDDVVQSAMLVLLAVVGVAGADRMTKTLLDSNGDYN
jgi:hypothetical protein